MRDYNSIINSLRNCVYVPCNQEHKSSCLAGREDDCKRELMAISADAIEELLRELNNQTVSDWCESCVYTDCDGTNEPCCSCTVKYDEQPTMFERSGGDDR